MSKKDHFHLYKRVNLARRQGKEYMVLACQDGCTHYIRVELANGRKARCWRCDEPFTMDGMSSKLARPHCDDCFKGRKPKRKGEIFDVDKMLADLSVKS